MQQKWLRKTVAFLLSVVVLSGCNPASNSLSSSAGNASTTQESWSSSPSSSSTQVNPPIQSGVYWRSPGIADVVYAISATSMSGDEMAMISSVQGILAQTLSRVYVYDGTADSKYWLSQLQSKKGFQVKEYTDAFALLADVKTYLPSKKYVTYKSVTTSGNNYNLSIDHAATVSGVEGWIMVDSSLVSKAIAAGFAPGIDVSDYTTRQIFEKYKSRLNNQLLLNQNPQKAMLRDYSIAAKAFCGYMDYITDDSMIRTEIGQWAAKNAPIIGWTENEVNFVSVNSTLSLITLAADWAISLSFLSGYSPAATLSFPNYQKRNITATKGKHYLAIVMSDGDNIQWLERTFMDDTRWYGSSRRGSFPMTWTVSPALADLGPGVLKSIYSRGSANDDFIAGPSGIGYINPSEYNETALPDYSAKTAGYMSRTGLSSVNFLDSFANEDSLAYFAAQNQIKGGVWSLGDYYLEGKGGVYWSNDKPFVSVRETLWRDGNDNHNKYYGFTERVAQRINSYKTDPTDISGYTVLIAHAWSIGTMEYINRFVRQLDDHVELVTVDELLDLVKANVPHTNVEQAADIAPNEVSPLCAIDSRAFYWKDVKDYPVTAQRNFEFTSPDDLGGWSLNCGGLEYDKCVWDSWSVSGKGSIRLDGSDLNDKMDAIPNSYMYNMFQLGSNESKLEILCKGGSNADTFFRVHVYYEDASLAMGYGEDILKDGYGASATFDDYGYYERADGSNPTTYDFSLSKYAGKKTLISLEQDDDGDGSGEQIFIDYVHIS